ncbi:MAG: hypothetical protein U0990_07220 [Candidatus Nanopelagicales bacterium]|nr:hypothetical protein [Candidatus Nanopelagicales bacterium]MDZ4249866.1 hypothetical protein [Candidatus Nanopelagicales bacterium]
MSDKEDTSKSDAQDAPLTDEEAQSVQGGAALRRSEWILEAKEENLRL